MYKLLDTKIMDRIVHEKWTGVNNETHSLLTYSTGYQLINDTLGNYVGLSWFRKIMNKACEWDRGELSHTFKLFIWKKSMLLRVNIELIIIIIYSLIFLELIIIFVTDLHLAEHEARALLDMRNGYWNEYGWPETADTSHGDSHASADDGHRLRNLAGGAAKDYGSSDSGESEWVTPEWPYGYKNWEYMDLEHHLHYDLVHALHEVDYILNLSMLHLLAPVSIMAKMFFISKTNRQSSISSMYVGVESILFCLVLLWIYDRKHYTHWDGHNLFMESDQTYSKGELFMLTVIWHIKANEYNIYDPNLPYMRFDIVLAFTAFFTLTKLFLQFEFTPSFGPLFKMLQRMLAELIKFLCIWMIQLSSFASVAVLAFGNLETFQTFSSSIIYFIGASMGEFDMEAFESGSINMTMLG
jgi:hypothetical protein